MSVKNIAQPYQLFHDLTGKALETGYIYIGEATLDPETYPVSIYWDAALTTAASNPVRTINGYLSQSGSPGSLYVNSDYSMTVKDKNGELIYTRLSHAEQDEAITFSVTGTDSGVTVKTIVMGDNSSALIEVYGSGVKGSNICVNKIVFSLYKETGAINIQKVYSEDISDGGTTGGYFECEISGSDAVIKAYTDSGTWAVSGSVSYNSSGTVSIS